MWEGHGFMGGGFMWLFWVVIIVFVVWGASAYSRGGGNTSTPRTSALDILKERYARGDIDKDEYEQKRRDLMG